LPPALLPILKENNHVNWNMQDHFGFTPVHDAVEKGQDAILKELLTTPPVGLNVDTLSDNGLPPSYYVVQHGKKQILEMLFDAGADPAWTGLDNSFDGPVTLPFVALRQCRYINRKGSRNLQYYTNQFEVLKFLISKQKDPANFFTSMRDNDVQKWYGPVRDLIRAHEDHRALANEMLEFLLDRGLDANLSSSDVTTKRFYLFDIAEKFNNTAAKELLASKGGKSWKEHHPRLAWAGSWKDWF
jgi:hypothetical protein